MTLYKPNLQVRRIRVMAGAIPAYDAFFHEGVNIISGQNASGKSTIMDFIFYALGGESIPWKNEALLCTDVFIELALNSVPVTLRRIINEDHRNPINIFWGDLASSDASSYSEWELYPYQRSTSKESFSQVLFRAIGLPELRGESASNITMHQIMRLMYVDQRTPHDEIFRAEPFDTQLTKETIGNYLCGIHNDELYDAQLELKKIDSQLDKAVTELRTLMLILGRSGQASANTLETLKAEQASVELELNQAYSALVREKTKRRKAPDTGDDAGARLSKLRLKLTELQKKFAVKSSELVEMELEETDSEKFIQELNRRIRALGDAESTKAHFGKVQFSFCPCCFSKIEPIVGDSGCSLCKGFGDSGSVASQILRMKNELALQRSESIKLQISRKEIIKALRSEIPKLRRELAAAENEFNTTAAEWTAPSEQAIEELSSKIGSLKQLLDHLSSNQRLAEIIEELQQNRADLQTRKDNLSESIISWEKTNIEFKAEANKSILQHLIYLLRNDVPRQEEFINASVVSWDFGENRVTVNGQRQFSESSMVILKHCFHLALLAASAEHSFFRFPRFLLLDGIDDGGQELERSHALQNAIVELSESLPSSHQIIFATSQIAPNLATSSLVVGPKTTVKKKSLNLHIKSLPAGGYLIN